MTLSGWGLPTQDIHLRQYWYLTLEAPASLQFIKNEMKKVSFSGQYHEIKPGQYHEVNPGQYHEVNPGQYHEDSPGQYHEHSPGQYHETNFGQYHEVNPGHYTHVPDDEVEVEVERVAGVPNRRVYNVQSKVDQFIIGEYGTINENSGQTLKGVRYTAVDDSTVDPKIIFDTLQKYFQFSWVIS